MRFSLLQKYILTELYASKVKVYSRAGMKRFYNLKTLKPKQGDRQSIITKSLERLIDKGLLIGYGRRTPHKWFISEVKLTSLGRRSAKELLGQQQPLPLQARKGRDKK